MTNPIEIMSLGLETEGMIPFFYFLGMAIKSDRAGLAYRALVKAGLSPSRAWTIVDQWDRTSSLEQVTGWTAEASAMGFVLNDVPDWRDVDWLELVVELS